MKGRIKAIIPTLALLAFGVALIVAGVFRNEVQTVLDKAIRICVECMGLG